ncbi:MAG TPA: IS5 family transposase [Pirellulales bacterium]|nr:IS5 family transposase [Pirellulales bacterium]
MDRKVLRDDQWERIRDLLPGKATDCGVTAKDNRLFLEAVLWIGRTGAPWRDLPPELGNWHTTFTRFARWAKRGVWERLFRALSSDRDLEEVMLDSTAVRAHQHAAGAKKNTGPQALGRARGGFGTKIHGLVDALGNPLGFTLTGAEQADITQAQTLLDQAPGTGAVIADKGYDADALIETITARNAEAVIPPRSNRKHLRDYDRHRYRARNLVERCFNLLKHYRRIATRYEKLSQHFAAMLYCRCILLWLK